MYPKRTLPLELVQNIGGQAAISDVKSLRLACKTFAALLAEDLFYCLVIDISRRDVQQQHRGFEILASLVSAESHPAWTATRELSIQQINLDEPSWQVASCLIPALKSLRNLTKIRLNNAFTGFDWIYTSVLDCLRPVIPRISGLEISGITNTTDLQPCDGNRMGVLISFLSNPQISLLETFAISSHGQGLESHIGSPLVTAATGVIDKSRHNLKSLAFVFPFARPTPTPPTIQCVFGPSTLRASFPVLTHLIMAEEIIYNIRSSTRTVPQFSSLKHLTCISREQMRPPSLIADSRPNTFDFWTALANTGVRLHSIKDATATHEMLHYLKSYSGELQELRIKRFRIRYEADKWQGLGEEFWNHVIPLHDTSLRLLHVQTNCNGWWSFGPVTQHVFSIYPFPQLEELKINIDTMAHGTLAEEKYMKILLDLTVQPRLFTSLRELITVLPAPVVVRDWCGTGRFDFTAPRRGHIGVASRTTGSTDTERTTRIESSSARSGPAAKSLGGILPHRWPAMARLPNLTVTKSDIPNIRLCPILTQDGWKYEHHPSEKLSQDVLTQGLTTRFMPMPHRRHVTTMWPL